MLLTVALVVLGCTICVIFSKELSNWINKIFTLPGMIVLLPILLATYLTVQFEPFLHWALLAIKFKLHDLISTMTSLMPFTRGAYLLVNLIVLVGLPMLAVGVLNFLTFKRIHKQFPYPYWVSSQIWLLLIILLSIPGGR